MKKLIIALGLIASTVATASVDEYSFTSTVKIPTISGNAKSGYYRSYNSVKYTGTLIVDSNDPTTVTGVLELSDKKSGQTLRAELDQDTIAILTGKKLNVPAVYLTVGDLVYDGFVLNFAGKGNVSTKKNGCGTCGDVSVCTRVTSVSGNVTGLYDCGCYKEQYPEIDGTCDVDYTKVSNTAPVWGSWSVKLVKVDGVKYR